MEVPHFVRSSRNSRLTPFRCVHIGAGDPFCPGGNGRHGDLRRHRPLGVRPARVPPGLLFARALPILVSMGIAWWAHRRLGPRVLEPLPVVSLLATCLSLRLVFEEGLFGYKFMALAVMLVLVAVVRGRIRGGLVAWLVLTSLAFTPIPTSDAINGRPWSYHVAAAFPLVCMATVLVLIVHGLIQKRVRWYLVAWLVIAACAFLRRPLWSFDSVRAPLPLWLWQLILLPTGVALAAGPLVSSIRAAGSKPPVSSVDLPV